MLDAEIPTTPTPVGYPNFGGYWTGGPPVGYQLPSYPRVVTHPTNGQPVTLVSATNERILLQSATAGSPLRQGWLAFLISEGK